MSIQTDFKLKNVFVLIVKFMPIIQMVGMIINNVLFYFDIETFTYQISAFLIGNSFITTILLIVCSYLFGFCKWHRLMILSNFINICIANIDIIFYIPITDFQLLFLYFTVYLIFIFIIIFNRFYTKWSC